MFPDGASGQILFNHLDYVDGIPQINVVSVYQDETGAMWFGTGTGLCRYNGHSSRTFYSSPEYPGLTKNSVLQITGNRTGAIYIRTEFDLIRYDIAADTFRVINDEATGMFYGNGKLWFSVGNRLYTWSEETSSVSFHSEIPGIGGSRIALYVSKDGDVWCGGVGGVTVVRNPRGENGKTSAKVLEGVFVYSLHIDSSGLVWVGTRNDGLYVLDSEGEVRSRFRYAKSDNSISDNFVRTIAEDSDGMIWVGTSMGLDSYDKITDEWTNYKPDETQRGSLNDYSVFSIYRDAQSTMWVGTYYGGVNYFNPRLDIFRYYQASQTVQDKLSYPFVGPMATDDDGNLWIGTDGGGLNCLDIATGNFTRYLYEEYDSQNMPQYHIKSICFDHLTGKLYMGVYGVGLWVFNTRTRSGVLRQRSDWSVMTMQRVGDKIVAHNGRDMFEIDTETDTLVPLTDDFEIKHVTEGEYIYRFFIDRAGGLWLSSHSGLRRVDLATMQSRKYAHDSTDPHSFGKSTVMSFIETAEGELFFGTLGSGLFRWRPETDDFDRFTVADGAQPSDFSYHISEMSDGKLLVLHNDCFSIFDPVTGATVYRSTANFPLSGFFEGNSSLITPYGEVFIGGVNGLVAATERDLTDPPANDNNLYFDRLTVNGEPVRPGDTTGILSASLPLTTDLKLKHNQNSISVEFAASDYSHHRPASGYKYSMEGLDEMWYTASSYTITYTSLPPGRYTLAVRDGDKSARLGITVRRPWWSSAFAQILYALLSVGIVVWLILFLRLRYRMKTALKVNEMKMGFFTNVSHEFRTPLTLIMAQTESILAASGVPESVRAATGKVYSNATHLRDLISELLDFRKAEAGFVTLQPELTDLVSYADDIWRSFVEYASKHSIAYRFDHPAAPVVANIDRAQFRKTIYNLLSNAFKYTNDRGAITLRLWVDDKIHIAVEDNGIGISPEAAARVFEKFYQAEHRTSGFSLGTGIGLALTKEIVESHGGTIYVRGALERGSVFEITLPLAATSGSTPKLPVQSAPIPPAPIPAKQTDGEAATILIVEDNDELRALLVEGFSASYTVLTAANGREGLEMTAEHLPDIVLTDRMMPEMSGTEMCRAIKEDARMAHIPVVMLTALASEEETIEGFMFGADDYVAKPFNMEILRARCGAILRGRRSLYRAAAESPTSTAVEIRSEQDRLFLEKVESIVRANFDNPDFDMSRLSTEIGMSRAGFYNKMKEIAGMTPNEFTIAVKLREAAELLKNHTHLQVAEIADRLGFYSTKNLSKYFKTFYGVTPSQWRKDNE